MFDEIRITHATDLPDSFREALTAWRTEAARLVREYEVEWYAKTTSTHFTFHEKRYVILPEDVFDGETVRRFIANFSFGALEARFEVLQKCLDRDLRTLGATNIVHYGFLD